MTIPVVGATIGVFHDHASAEQALAELRKAGFKDDQLGVLGRESGSIKIAVGDSKRNYAAAGATGGAIAGAGLGTLWGLGLAAAALGPLGPIFAGGALAAIASSAALGAAAAGLTGLLVGLGIPKVEAEFYESQLHAGRILVSVHAPGREAEARAIMRACGADQSHISEQDHATAAAPLATVAPPHPALTPKPHTEFDLPLGPDVPVQVDTPQPLNPRK